MQICTATIMRGHATSILHAAEFAERARMGAGEGGRVQAAWERAVGGEVWGFADAELIGWRRRGARRSVAECPRRGATEGGTVRVQSAPLVCCFGRLGCLCAPTQQAPVMDFE